MPEQILTRWVVRLCEASAVLMMLGCMAAQGQALPTASGGGAYFSIGGGATAMQADYGQRILAGGMVYADSNATPSLGLELEAKFLRWHTDEDVTETTYLAGVRYSFRSQKRWSPYAKVLAGEGNINLPFNYAHGSYLAIAPGAGLEYHFAGRWTARVIDVEYQDWPQFTYGALHPYGVSAGMSFRVTGQELFPKKMRHRH